MRWGITLALVILMATGESCKAPDTSGLPRGEVTSNEWSDSNVNAPGKFKHTLCVRPAKKERDGNEPEPVCVTRNTVIEPWKKCQVGELYPMCTEGRNN